jgi:hypothetical protein
LIRLSVGIEDKGDLINDLVNALDSLGNVKRSSAFCSDGETSIAQESLTDEDVSATCRLSPALAALW